MAYTPTTWNDGDLITAEKLNKLEAGVQNEQVGPQGPAGPKGDTGTQGPAGADGADGAAAGFGTPTATVDANTGAPSVTVTASGPNTAKVFSFAFKNLKGAKGDTGAQGPAGKTGPQGQQGAQGAAGARGPAGKGVKSIALTTTGGAVTGGTVTFDDDSTEPITVTATEGT